MLSFAPLTETNLAALLPILLHYPTGACDCTPGGIFMWRAFFDTHVALISDTLLVRIRYYDGSTRVMYPLGKAPERALSALCDEVDAPLQFAALLPGQLCDLKRLYGKRVRAHFERSICDYLYNPQELSLLSGKKYAGERNHRNQFYLKNRAEFTEICDGNRAEALAFYDANFLENGEDTPLAAEERLRSRELLENPCALALCTLLLRANGAPVALCVGERVGDTLYVHTEKALRSVRGAHQALLSEFARRYCADCRFCNREEDDGVAGLRAAKLALHPTQLLKKYSATLEV